MLKINFLLRQLPQYKSIADMPTWLLVLFCFSSTIVSGYFSYALSDVLPEYITVANQVSPLNSVTGILATLGILLFMLIVGTYGMLAKETYSTLSKRVFP